jgi:hypothetical protein
MLIYTSGWDEFERAARINVVAGNSCHLSMTERRKWKEMGNADDDLNF